MRAWLSILAVIGSIEISSFAGPVSQPRPATKEI
jgi:hypothetical protein